MKKVGKVIKYNGLYGYIKSEEELIDFSKKDISLNEVIKENDCVEFRIEDKGDGIKIARNIAIYEKLDYDVELAE